MSDLPRSSREDDPIEQRYRQVSAADPSRPSEAVRRAVLDQAAAHIGRPRSARVRARLWASALAAALAGVVVVLHVVERRASIGTPGMDAATVVRHDPTSPPSAAAPPVSESAPAPMAPMAESLQPSRSREVTALARSRTPSNANENTGHGPSDLYAQRGDSTALKAPPDLQAAPSPSAPAPAPVAPLADSLPRLRGNRMAALTPNLAAANAGEKTRQDALGSVAERGDIATLKALLDQSIDINARDSAGRTALLRATASLQIESVDLLLAHGADPNLADAQGKTPLQTAAENHHPQLVAALRKAGAR